MITLGNLSLPDDLRWTNRTETAAVAMAAQRRLDGGLVVFVRAQELGRPILLEAGEDGALSRADQLALEQLASVAGARYALEIPAEGLSVFVMFDWRDGSPLDLRPVTWFEDPAADDWVAGTIKLVTV
jgi:hypothetical protein